ncbi:MAG: hypothetical protein IPL61_00305 [Myxococcales bacterium]|nr:hypothetical protein [Myxococcales bacterium]
MALTAARWKTLRRKTVTRDVEVEDLLEVARLGSRADAAGLRALAAEHRWSRGRGGHGRRPPLGRWADVVCAFLERGAPGLDAMRRRPGGLAFCCGLLARVQTPASVAWLARAGARAATRADARAIADALNLICSFKAAPVLPPAAAALARRFLHRQLTRDPSPHARASAICALRGIGDHTSLPLIAAAPPLPAIYRGVDRLAVRAITKRSRR